MPASVGRYHRTIVGSAPVVLTGALLFAVPAAAYDRQLADDARATLDRAARYFADTLSVEGAYVWTYSEDLTVRKGEDKAAPRVGWVQPPGTPAVGAAFLRLYEETGDQAWLDAARASGRALVGTQLLSGGWYYSLELDEAARAQWCYRADGVTPEACGEIQGNRVKNRTLLDDDTTQSALRFLIWLDEIEGGKDPPMRDAILYGLKRLSTAQYPNGAQPVVIEKRRKEKGSSTRLQATLPADWPREWVKPDRGPYYILNDDIQRDVIHLYLIAAERFGDKAYRDAAVRAGDFLIDAQLPAPQRGWAQTYGPDMQPVWGRKFEPPSVASRETAGAIIALVELYERTGEARFLAAAREGAAWLRSVRLPDGDWARFYELSTDRPLYVDNDEKLTYDTNDLLDHYNLKNVYDIPDALDYFDSVEQGQPRVRPLWPSPADDMSDAAIEAKVRDLVRGIDAKGRWVEDGWIKSQTFVDAAFIITSYLKE